jgi:UDP-4-amino-4,6-dideoxy-N-acetyl-beta-L-altrosamine transaminase
LNFIPQNPIPYGRQTITDDDVNAVVSVLRSDFLTQGPAVPAFEQAFARYIGGHPNGSSSTVKAVAVSSGAAALHLCAIALGVKPGDRVITTPITFTASANCIRYCGGEVVFSDIDPDTYLLDIHKVRGLLEAAPKAERGLFKGVVPVDFAGLPVDMQAWRDLADEFSLWILEDSCHAPGASFTDSQGAERRAGDGSLADLAIFSFHPVKHIATAEGGAITTTREDLYKQLCALRTHGITREASIMHENHGGWYYEMHELGYNYRLSDVQAALGMTQLGMTEIGTAALGSEGSRAERGLARRRMIAERYYAAFEGTNVIAKRPDPRFHHAYHLFVVEVAHRKACYDALRSKGIYAQVHYIPVHLQPYYRNLGWKQGMMPYAEAYYECCLSLPMFPALTDAEQQYVIDAMLEITVTG